MRHPINHIGTIIITVSALGIFSEITGPQPSLALSLIFTLGLCAGMATTLATIHTPESTR